MEKRFYADFSVVTCMNVTGCARFFGKRAGARHMPRYEEHRKAAYGGMSKGLRKYTESVCYVTLFFRDHRIFLFFAIHSNLLIFSKIHYSSSPATGVLLGTLFSIAVNSSLLALFAL